MILRFLVQICITAGATLCFTVLFNIRGWKKLLAAAGGALGWGVYLLVMENAGSDILAFFCASLGIGLYAEICAAVSRNPATAFTVCAIIPLVPGSGMYYTMSESIGGDIQGALSSGLKTLLVAGAIAAGIAFSSSLRKILVVILRGLGDTRKS
jgi:uncharacterized membrane protein YjjB (DUF3815 family)